MIKDTSTTSTDLISTKAGLLTYPAFLFVLERECHRSKRANRPLALCLFAADHNTPDPPASRPDPALVEAILPHFLQVKRQSDILAHYQENKLALLLPNTSLTAAKTAARRISKALETADPSFHELFSFSFGVTDATNDGTTLNMVLNAAERSLDLARTSGPRVLSFRDMLLGISSEERSRLHKERLLASATQALYSSVIDELKQKLTAQQTGVFTKPVFHFFFELDYKRALRENQSLSVIVFSLEISPSGMEPASLLCLKKELLNQIDNVKRKGDIIAEYEAGRFAILLPDTSLSKAEALALRIKQLIERKLSSAHEQAIQVKVELFVADALRNYPQLAFWKVTTDRLSD